MLSQKTATFQNDTKYSSNLTDWSDNLSEVRTAAPGVMSNLAATKYYTPIPQPVLSYICLHDRLSDGAKVLWFHLYRSAAQWENWTIRRGVPALAHELGVGQRTIRRRMDELEKNALVVRSARFLDQRQLVNEIRVTLPYAVASLIQQRVTDRHAPAHRHQHRQHRANTRARPDTRLPQPPVAELPTANGARSSQETGEQPVDKREVSAKNVRPEPVRNDRPNSNKHDIPREKTPSQPIATNPPAHSCAGNPLQSLLATLTSTPVQQGPETPMYDLNPRIQKRLRSMGFYGRQQQQLAAEIVYSVTHHDWRGCRAKAVNACLKLVKQNRWRTPKGMAVTA